MRKILTKENIKKILFTLAILFIYRIGSAITVTGVNTEYLKYSIGNSSPLTMMNMLGGGALERMSVFALGVGPYITAGIIIQLLSMDVVPYLTDAAKEGSKGRQKIENITRYLAIFLALVQSISTVYGFDKQYGILEATGFINYLYVAIILTAGTQLLVWLGDRISVHGIGNGISLIIFAGIVANIPSNFIQTFNVLVGAGEAQSQVFQGVLQFVLYCILYLVIIVGVVIMQLAVRKIPIQYSKGVTTTSSNNTSFLPFKINSASVIPVIFAGSVISAPQIILSFINYEAYQKLSNFLSFNKPSGLIIYGVLIVLFTFFYTNLQLDPEEISKNLQKQSANIIGIRPGSETKTYLKKVLNRITVFGALALLFIAVLPHLITMFTSIPQSAALGGTGIIIAVGVAMEVMNQLKSDSMAKNYGEFLR